MVWKFCLCVMIVSIMCACALPENPSTMFQFVRKRETPHRYCGRHLVSILQLLCGSNYNGDIEKKRSSEIRDSKPMQDADELPWLQSQPFEEGSEAEFPFRSRSVANSLRNRLFRRHSRDGGIVDECCIYKGCTTSELAEYCLDR
uniref:ILP1 n=1 Tax=Blattella germanica TaxID=6973 RepID=A0A0D6DR34_BLAGE|nr:Insulin-like peptide 1 [Blattella germanica]SPC71615.1 ILP1 [Blattella germanica]